MEAFAKLRHNCRNVIDGTASQRDLSEDMRDAVSYSGGANTVIRTTCIAFATLALSAGLATAAETIGSAYAIAGSVTGTQRPGSPRLLSRGSDVHFRELIRARAASNGQFRFVDGSRFVVGAGSEVVLDEFVFRGARVARQAAHDQGGAALSRRGNPARPR